MLITASAKAGGGRKKKKFAGEDRILPVGSILDVQGCRSFSTANAKGLPQDPVSIVRLNMGSFSFNSLRKRPEKLGYLANLLDMQRRAGEGMKSMKELRQKRLSETKGIVAMHTQNRIVVHDGVLEVVGYMGTYDAGDQELVARLPVYIRVEGIVHFGLQCSLLHFIGLEELLLARFGGVIGVQEVAGEIPADGRG